MGDTAGSLDQTAAPAVGLSPRARAPPRRWSPRSARGRSPPAATQV